MSDTLEERIRATARENPDMGTVKAFAGDLVELLDEKDAIVILMKANPIMRLTSGGRHPKKMYWADDLHQWEVFISKPDTRGLVYVYQGTSLKEALAALMHKEE